MHFIQRNSTSFDLKINDYNYVTFPGLMEDESEDSDEVAEQDFIASCTGAIKLFLFKYLSRKQKEDHSLLLLNRVHLQVGWVQSYYI